MHHVLARWLDVEHSTPMLGTEAIRDVEDIRACDAFVVLDLCLSEGKATEFGMAYVLGKSLIVVGTQQKNVFHLLPGVHHAQTVREAIQILDTLEDTTWKVPPRRCPVGTREV